METRLLKEIKNRILVPKWALALLLMMVALGLKAKPVDLRIAREVGVKFMSANTKTPLRGAGDLQLAVTYSINRGAPAFYIFNTQNGFVIVSADDRAIPVLGYSDEGQFDVEHIPIQLQDYLQDFLEQVQYGIENCQDADETTAQQWELVLTTGYLTEQKASTVVEPLLTDTWGQNCYYNSLCPADPNGHCGHASAGCVATSFSQIMRYWNYPISGIGSHTYTPSGYPQQTANFGATTYDWANMPNSLSSTSTSDQVSAVATLMWHCGVAVDMMYDANVSGAYYEKVADAFVNYFGYSDELSKVYRRNYNDASWLTLMKDCLDLGFPIHYNSQNANGGVGHSFVCDGYDTNNNLHFNWGWSGVNNGYYSINAMNPGNYVYTKSNMAIINIHPDCSLGTSYHYQLTATANPSNGGNLSGSGIYGCGEICTLNAMANEGYVFDNWTKDGEVVSYLSSYTLSVAESAEYVANFRQMDGISIGDATYSDVYLPTYSYQSMSQQIYTADELDTEACEISNVSFFNAGATKTRNLSVYMVNTAKTSFESSTDWIAVTEADMVFSGSLTMVAKEWITINFNTLFSYDGSSNVALIIDDNTNSLNTSIKCRTFDSEGNQSLCIFGSGTNFTPYNPSGYEGTLLQEKNQIIFGLVSYDYNVTVSASPANGGTVSGGGGIYYYGQSIPISATTNEGFVFNNWTKNNEVVSCLSVDHVSVTETAEYVASFQQVDGIVIGDATYANPCLPSHTNQSLSQQIYTADEMGVGTCSICSVTFFNTGAAKTSNLSIYMVNTAKTSFESPTDWIAVEEEDLVLNGSVTMAAMNWTTIYFNTPFNYDGSSNVALIIDDNTNKTGSSLNCRTFDADGNQALCINGSEINYNPYNTSGYTGVLMSEKSQVIFGVSSDDYTITLTANPSNGGTVSGVGGLYYYGESITINAASNEGYVFDNWTKDGTVVSYLSSIAIPVTGTAEYVANFRQMNGIIIGDAGIADSYLPTHSYQSLSEQIYTAEELGAQPCEVSSIALFNAGVYRKRKLSVYMVHTTKTVFENTSDWIAATEADLVFSGSVSFLTKEWVTINFDTPFNYDGSSNVVLIIDDNSNSFNVGLRCRTFNTDGNQALSVFSTNNGFNPYNPGGYTGTLMSEKNQIVLGVTFSTIQQTNTLQQGWNWWSSYVELEGINGLTMLENSLGQSGDVIKSKDYSVQWNGQRWRGSLSSINNEQGYYIHVTETCDVYLNGSAAHPENHPITLYPNWNWIGYPVSAQQAVGTALANVQASNHDVIKGRNGFATFRNNHWLPANFMMKPGEMYKYYSNASNSLNFVFADSRESVEMETAECYWKNNLYAYPDNLNIVATVTVCGVEQRDESIELGAFVNDECRGSVRLYYVESIDRYIAFLTVTGQEDEQVEFRMMDQSKGTIGRSDDYILFHGDAIVGNLDHPFNIRFSVMNGLSETKTDMRIYPNPIDRNMPFTIALSDGEMVSEVQVYNTMGEAMAHWMGIVEHPVMSGLPASGVYMLKVVCKSGNVYLGKLVVK